MNLKEMQDNWQGLRNQIDALEDEWWSIENEKNKKLREVKAEYELKFDENNKKKKVVCSEASELWDKIDRIKRNRNGEQRRNVWFT